MGRYCRAQGTALLAIAAVAVVVAGCGSAGEENAGNATPSASLVTCITFPKVPANPTSPPDGTYIVTADRSDGGPAGTVSVGLDNGGAGWRFKGVPIADDVEVVGSAGDAISGMEPSPARADAALDAAVAANPVPFAMTFADGTIDRMDPTEDRWNSDDHCSPASTSEVSTPG